MKSNTNDVRLEIAQIIYNATSVKAFYLHRPSSSYPYIVFELRELSSVDGQTSAQLDIDVVTKDIKQVNTLADSIQDALDHDVVRTTKILFHTYQARRYAVVEDDKSIQRIHLQMDLYLYSKEEIQ